MIYDVFLSTIISSHVMAGLGCRWASGFLVFTKITDKICKFEFWKFLKFSSFVARLSLAAHIEIKLARYVHNIFFKFLDLKSELKVEVLWSEIFRDFGQKIWKALPYPIARGVAAFAKIWDVSTLECPSGSLRELLLEEITSLTSLTSLTNKFLPIQEGIKQ